MTTESRLAANRANALLSTGPRTEAGKTSAAQNARKHGLTASQLVIVEAEQDAFSSIASRLGRRNFPGRRARARPL